MTKKSESRHSLTDLVSQFKFEDIQPEPTTQKTKAKVVDKKSSPTEENFLDKLKPETTSKTRITLDLDAETYQQLVALAEYTGQPKAKLLRSLINEIAKLLQK